MDGSQLSTLAFEILINENNRTKVFPVHISESLKIDIEWAQ